MTKPIKKLNLPTAGTFVTVDSVKNTLGVEGGALDDAEERLPENSYLSIAHSLRDPSCPLFPPTGVCIRAHGIQLTIIPTEFRGASMQTERTLGKQ
jgi:hypothetical protein